MFIVSLLLSVLIGVVLGLLGGGGSILTTPILLYGLHLEPRAAIATSLLVVCVTSAAALIPHARAGHVAWKTGATFGVAGMTGAYAAGFVAGRVPERALLLLFAGMMIATSVAMFRGRAAPEVGATPRPTWRGMLDGLVVGAVTGLVGAGGGFLVVPALVLMGGLPMADAVGTSLLVIAMQAGAGFLGHAAHVTVDLKVAGMVTAAAVIGAFLGSALSPHIPPERLRKGFAGFVLLMAGFVIAQQA
jgi:uncharacterized membrane protein YfcA